MGALLGERDPKGGLAEVGKALETNEYVRIVLSENPSRCYLSLVLVQQRASPTGFVRRQCVPRGRDRVHPAVERSFGDLVACVLKADAKEFARDSLRLGTGSVQFAT